MQQEDQKAALGRQAVRRMQLSFLGTLVIGVVFILVPGLGRHSMHLYIGIIVIALSLFLLGWVAYVRRRYWKM